MFLSAYLSINLFILPFFSSLDPDVNLDVPLSHDDGCLPVFVHVAALQAYRNDFFVGRFSFLLMEREPCDKP